MAQYPAYEGNGGKVEGSGTTVDVPYPLTINANDILIMMCVYEGAGRTIATPSGWTLMEYINNSSSTNVYLFYKRAIGSETGNETLTITIATLHLGVMLRYSASVTTGTPYEDLTEVSTAYDNNWDAAAITTTDVNRLAVCYGYGRKATAVTSYPSSYTVDQGNVTTIIGNDYCIAWSHDEIATATTTSLEEGLFTGAGIHAASHTFALIPAAAGYDKKVNRMEIDKIDRIELSASSKVDGM